LDSYMRPSVGTAGRPFVTLADALDKVPDRSSRDYLVCVWR